MGILTKEVEIKMNTKTVKHYESLGYEIPKKKATELSRKTYKKEYVYDFKSPIKVKVEDLTKGCKAVIRVKCDICKQAEMDVVYNVYKNTIESTGSYVCKECAKIKQRNTSLNKYGVPYYTYTDEFKEKVSETILAKYGCKNVSQSNSVKEKKNETFYKNSSQKSSRQQRYICRLYNGILNFPIKHYSADIYFSDDKLICEYDGSGHFLKVDIGNETIEEFNNKELIRYNIIKREGYKQMKIVSSHDKLPSDTILLQMLDISKNYFNTTQHSWITFDIDQSLMFNAENKDGVYFDFGELRTIKKEDAPNKEDISDVA